MLVLTVPIVLAALAIMALWALAGLPWLAFTIVFVLVTSTAELVARRRRR